MCTRGGGGPGGGLFPNGGEDLICGEDLTGAIPSVDDGVVVDASSWDLVGDEFSRPCWSLLLGVSLSISSPCHAPQLSVSFWSLGDDVSSLSALCPVGPQQFQFQSLLPALGSLEAPQVDASHLGPSVVFGMTGLTAPTFNNLPSLAIPGGDRLQLLT